MKEGLYKGLTVIFTVTLALFMLMGAVIVIVQLIGIVMGNGDMVLSIHNRFNTYAIRVSALCGFAGFFAAYLKPRKRTGKYLNLRS
ncbi:MAG: hypothetical protein LBQ58_02785 [Synergistaceae bacterium]|jgi:hypothetical protein|nr:hypothetical protein [Synergistaceae bacterium]